MGCLCVMRPRLTGGAHSEGVLRRVLEALASATQTHNQADTDRRSLFHTPLRSLGSDHDTAVEKEATRSSNGAPLDLWSDITIMQSVRLMCVLGEPSGPINGHQDDGSFSSNEISSCNTAPHKTGNVQLIQY